MGKEMQGVTHLMHHCYNFFFFFFFVGLCFYVFVGFLCFLWGGLWDFVSFIVFCGVFATYFLPWHQFSCWLFFKPL